MQSTAEFRITSSFSLALTASSVARLKLIPEAVSLASDARQKIVMLNKCSFGHASIPLRVFFKHVVSGIVGGSGPKGRATYRRRQRNYILSLAANDQGDEARYMLPLLRLSRSSAVGSCINKRLL